MTTTATAPSAIQDPTASQSSSTLQTAAFAGVRRVPPPVNDRTAPMRRERRSAPS